MFREYGSGDSPSEGGEGGAQPELTPQQQHQQYLGDSRPELPPFPEIQWAGNPIPGQQIHVLIYCIQSVEGASKGREEEMGEQLIEKIFFHSSCFSNVGSIGVHCL